MHDRALWVLLAVPQLGDPVCHTQVVHIKHHQQPGALCFGDDRVQDIAS